MFGVDRTLIRGIMLVFLIMPFLWTLASSLIQGNLNPKPKAVTKKSNENNFLISMLSSVLLWKLWDNK